MPCQLSADCLNEIFEYLEDEEDLYSCLLVNHLWCEVSVRFLWTNVQNYDTLIACLPNESKEILNKNEIIISTPTSKPPLFNYVAFIKRLSIGEVDKKIESILRNQKRKSITSQSIVMQEIFKLFMNQISLKELEFYYLNSTYISEITFPTYPGAIDCLKYLLEFSCSSDIYSEFFSQLSQVCHNIRSLYIELRYNVSNGLIDLISVQKNLKYLSISQFSEYK